MTTDRYDRLISVFSLGEMPIQSCGQSVSDPRGKVGVRLRAHTQLRAKRQRSAREAMYRNRPICQALRRGAGRGPAVPPPGERRSRRGAPSGRGLHSFPFPLSFSLLCPFQLNSSL